MKKQRQKEIGKNGPMKQPRFYKLKSGEEYTNVKSKTDERRKKL